MHSVAEPPSSAACSAAPSGGAEASLCCIAALSSATSEAVHEELAACTGGVGTSDVDEEADAVISSDETAGIVRSAQLGEAGGEGGTLFS